MEKTSGRLQILNVVSAVMMLAALALVFLYAPEELVMGQVQRIFYFHVPSAWVSFLAFFVTVVAGIAYLRTGKLYWDQVASSSVEVGLLFTLTATIGGAVPRAIG